jgi:hypothetical protein
MDVPKVAGSPHQRDTLLQRPAPAALAFTMTDYVLCRFPFNIFLGKASGNSAPVL